MNEDCENWAQILNAKTTCEIIGPLLGLERIWITVVTRKSIWWTSIFITRKFAKFGHEPIKKECDQGRKNFLENK